MTTHSIANGRLAARAKRGIHSALLRANLDLVRHPPMRRLVTLANALGVESVLDVGANTGQFAISLRASGYRGAILSFEPLTDAFAQLESAAAADAAWHVERVAVGAEASTLVMHRAGNSYSSSLLEMTKTHEDAAPESRVVGAETVSVESLDDLLARRGLSAEGALLKIDTQGYEQAVLDGAASTLGDVALVKLELSVVELYSGQALFAELQTYLLSRGFTMCGVEPGFADVRTGQMLQFDATFARSGLLASHNMPSM